MSNRSAAVEAELPLKPVVLQILLALAELGTSHGYGVMQAVGERSKGRIRLATGPFYRHLARLLDGGLVEEAPARPKEDDPRRGAYYRLTARGRAVLRAEAHRLSGVLSLTEELGMLPGKGSP